MKRNDDETSILAFTHLSFILNNQGESSFGERHSNYRLPELSELERCIHGNVEMIRMEGDVKTWLGPDRQNAEWHNNCEEEGSKGGKLLAAKRRLCSLESISSASLYLLFPLLSLSFCLCLLLVLFLSPSSLLTSRVVKSRSAQSNAPMHLSALCLCFKQSKLAIEV